MNGASLRRLISHAYSDGNHSYHYAPVEVDRDDALVNEDNTAASDDPADSFTYWPPQPMTSWFEEPQT